MNSIIKWSGLAVTLIGAMCTSFNITPVNVYLLNLGAVLYLIWSIRVKDLNLTIVNIGLLVIYGSGTVYRLLGN
jgi:hypothetical protein